MIHCDYLSLMQITCTHKHWLCNFMQHTAAVSGGPPGPKYFGCRLSSCAQMAVDMLHCVLLHVLEQTMCIVLPKSCYISLYVTASYSVVAQREQV